MLVVIISGCIAVAASLVCLYYPVLAPLVISIGLVALVVLFIVDVFLPEKDEGE